MNSDNFVVKFIVRRGRRKKRISVGDEKVENVYNLHKTGEKRRMVRQEMELQTGRGTLWESVHQTIKTVVSVAHFARELFIFVHFSAA